MGIGVIISIIFIASYYFGPTLCVDPAPGANFNDPIFGCKTGLQRLITHPLLFFATPTVVGLLVGSVYGKIRNSKQI